MRRLFVFAFACMSIVACKRNQEKILSLSEHGFLKSSCASGAAVSGLTRIASGNIVVTMVHGDACGNKPRSGLRLADPAGGRPSYRGVMVLDGVYGNKNPEIMKDLRATKAAYEKAGWLVVDTTNQTSQNVNKTVAKARTDHPELFDGTQPFQVVQVAHGGEDPEGGLTIGAEDTRVPGGGVSYSSEKRVGEAIRGAGQDVSADVFISACHSGSFCERETGAEGQINNVFTSSKASQMSWNSDKSAQEQWLQRINDAQTEPAKYDKNEDGLVTYGEAMEGGLSPGKVKVGSVYHQGQWQNSTDAKNFTTGDAAPAQSDRKISTETGVRRDPSTGLYTFGREYSYPQTPTGDEDAVITTVPGFQGGAKSTASEQSQPDPAPAPAPAEESFDSAQAYQPDTGSVAASGYGSYGSEPGYGSESGYGPESGYGDVAQSDYGYSGGGDAQGSYYGDSSYGSEGLSLRNQQSPR